jgi:hypothetical protein
MTFKQFARLTTKWSAIAAGLAASSYAGCVATAFLRYGKPRRPKGPKADPLLDIFMPIYDVADRHGINVAAPADVALAAASGMNLGNCPVVSAIFKGRELILRSKPDNVPRPAGLIAGMQSIGWHVLAELPGREIVMGAVTKPWEPNPVFRGMPPDEFISFQESGYVKIVWTLRADPRGTHQSIFRTETRAVATDRQAREKFRRYWAFLSPGIIAIRRAMLPAVKIKAERRSRAAAAA